MIAGYARDFDPSGVEANLSWLQKGSMMYR